jgi:eukaryotic-like serine/threonine-protein kinase
MALTEGIPAGFTGYDPFEGTAYRAGRRLRAGGMGELYLVEHRATGRIVVAKLLHQRLASDARLVERLRIEAQSAAQIDHHHVVKVLGVDRTTAGQLFIVMEYLQGRTLAEQMAAEGVPHVLEAVAFTCQLLSALQATHAKGLVHRDIKPDNLFICEAHEGPRYLKLLDFGVARVMPGSTAVEPLPQGFETRTGVVVGTPRFVSPEGAMGQRVDPRADLYSVGLVLYIMLAGRGPFDHFEGDHMLLTAHAAEDPEAPSRLATEPVPPELDRAVLKALAKDPTERFQSAQEFQNVLEMVAKLLQEPTGWLETSTFDPSMVRASVDAVAPTVPIVPAAPSVPAAVGPLPVEQSRAAPPQAETLEPSLVASKPRLGVGQVMLFVVGVLIAGLAVVGLVTVLQGRGP